MPIHLIAGSNSAAGVTIVLNDALSIGANALTCGAITGTTGYLNGNLTLTAVAADSRYIVLDVGAAGTGNLLLQGGGGSAGFGGSLILYSHSHATRPGWSVAGISLASGGKFAVNTQGLGGGTNVLTCDTNGLLTLTGGLTATTGTFSGAVTLGANALTCGAITASGVLQIKQDDAGLFVSRAAGTYGGKIYSDLAGGGKLTFSVGGSAAYNVFMTVEEGLALAAQTLNIIAAGGVTFSGAARTTSATGGVGYATGAGGTVTQPTSKATAFTLSKVTGQITLAGDALGADTTVSATWTNTAIAATDVVLITHVSGGTLGAYTFNVQAGAGTATLNIRNVTPGSLTETPVLGFVVIKGVTA